ncbi:hypothetical protein SNEBB_001825 [Seison nebaliae]|nr:hypothetical protein SNEBB_001825 [Seison nebaliae]
MNSSFRPSIASSMGNVGDIVEIEKVKGKKKLKSALSANLLKNKKLKNFKNKIIKTIQVSSSEDEDDNDESVGIEVAYVDERSSSKTENDKESEIVGENELENVENENHDDGNEKIINYDEDIRSKISQKSINKTDVDADDELDDSSSDSFDAGPQSRVKVRDLNKKLRSNAFPILDMFTTPKSEKDEMDIVNSDIASSDDSEKIIEKEIPTNDLGDSERVREEYEQLKKKYLRFSAEDQKRKSLKNKGKKVEEEEEEETEDDIEANNDQNGDLITNVTDYFTNMINAPIQLFSSLFTGEETNKTNIEEIKEKEEEEEEEEKKSDVEIEENSSVEGKRIKKKKRMKKKMKKLEEEHRKKYEKRLMRQSLKKVRKWKRDQPNKIVRRCYSSFTAPTTLQRFTVYIKSRSESVCHSQKYCECSSQLKTKKVVIEDSPTSIIDVSFSEIGETHKRNTFRYNGAKWNLFKNAIAAVRRDGENDYDISLSSSFGRKSNGKLSVKQILEFSNDEKMRVLGNLDVKKLSKLHNSSIVVAKTCHLEDIIDDPKLEDLSDRSSEIRSTGQRYDDDDVMESPKSESERDEKMLDKLKSFAMHENASTGSPVPQSKRKYSGLSINNKFVENVCGGKLYVCLESIHVQLLRCRHRILKKLNGSSEEEYDGPEFDSDLSYGEDIPGSQRKKKKKKKRKRFHSKKTRKLAMRRYGIDPTTIYRDRDGKTVI